MYIQLSIVQMDIGHFIVVSVVNGTDGLCLFHMYVQLAIVQMDIGGYIVHSVVN